MRPDKSIIYLLLLVITTSCSQNEQGNRIPKQYTSEQLRNNLEIQAADFNKDETKVLVDNNSTGIFNVYLLNMADSTMQPLTASAKESFFAVGFLPGTDRFIFTHDEGGNENSHLYLMNKGDTAAKDLTPWKNSTNSFFGWGADK